MLVSAGVLPFRASGEVLIGHPGGPVWARRDVGAWTIVKGLIERDETPLEAAFREFFEETGWFLDPGRAIDLGSVTLRSGKLIWGFGVEAPHLDPATLTPQMITITLGGRTLTVPEIDRVEWCPPDVARIKLNPAQAVFLERLRTP